MHADEALAIVVHEGEQSGLLFRVHLEIAAGVEEHGVEVIQIFGVVFELQFCEDLGVGSNGGCPEAGLAAQAFNGGHGVGYRFMAVAFFFAEHQKMLHRLSAGLSLSVAWSGERHE